MTSLNLKNISRSILLPGFSFFFLSVISACNSTNVGDGLRPTASVGNQVAPAQIQSAQSPANTLAMANSSETTVPSNALTPGNDGMVPTPGVTFLPVLGPPQSAVTQLSSSIRSSARGNGVTIVPNGQSGAQYQVKGYFSALDDGSGTRLIFIWDVLDRNGKNIHRISGEERTGSQNANPWTAVDSAMITAIVERTMINLRNWMTTRG